MRWVRGLCQVVILLGFLILWGFATPADKSASPLSPRDEAASFRLADDDLTIELVASEPDVVSPVAIAWDEDGRMFVAEMFDYPIGPETGRIKLLEDTKGTGAYDKVTVFVDKLPFPNGVLPWNGGLLVTAAPDIWFFKDTNDDGVADEKRVVLTGFTPGNQQLRVNGLMFGLDNWVYGANGRSGGAIRKPDDPKEKAVPIPRSDFRFRPETGQVQAVAGFSQFGLAKDDFGNRFPSWNTTPFRHVVLEERYLSRNPYLAATGGVASIADPRDPGRVYSISPPPTTFNREPVNYFNASCGNTVYRGDMLPERYRRSPKRPESPASIFVCEPLTNLVQWRVLKPDGGLTFVALRVEDNKEFLASTDPWFHPVNLATGPDGALYVVDFYRKWVEHPDFVPPNLKKTIDWRSGANHGRIWRIRQKNVKTPSSPTLSRATTEELVKCLSHPNGWRRDTAQRLLVERKDSAAVPLLKDALTDGDVFARIHALGVLEGLGAIDEDVMVKAMFGQPLGETCEFALRLADERVDKATKRVAWQGAMKIIEGPFSKIEHERVFFQCVLILGESDGPDKLKAFVRVADVYPGDEWMRLAILSGLKNDAWPFLKELVTAPPKPCSMRVAVRPSWLVYPKPDEARLLTEVAALIGVHHTNSELCECLALLTESKEGTARYGRLAILVGLAEGLARSGKPLRKLLDNPPADMKKLIPALEELLSHALATARSDKEEPFHRVLAIRVLAQAKPASGDKLLELLQPRHPQVVQTAAGRALTDLGDKKLLAQVVDDWGSYTLSTRRQLLDGLLRSAASAALLVDALEQDKLAVAELDAAARETLRRLPDKPLQERVGRILAKNVAADRKEVLRKYQPALTLKGDPHRGAELFAKNCLQCHQMQGQGHRVGSDLSGVAARPREALLTDILDPSFEVAPDYMNFLVVTTRGQVLTGLIAAETGTSVKLRRGEGVEDTILRSEIQELRPSGKSLMPEGLEQSLSVQDVADLLAFLQKPAPLPAGTSGKDKGK